MVANTERMPLGQSVTNPLVRDPTGTASLLATERRLARPNGSWYRSGRVMAKKQATVGRLEATAHLICDLTAGEQANHQERRIQIVWADVGIPLV